MGVVLVYFPKLLVLLISLIHGSAVDREWGQTKDYKIGICCFLH